MNARVLKISISLLTIPIILSLSTQSLDTSENFQPSIVALDTLPLILTQTIEKPPENTKLFIDGFKPPLRKWIVTSAFGIREDVWGGPDQDFHKGVDLVSPNDDKDVLASADGVVLVHWLPPGTVRGSKVYKGHPVYGAMILIAHEHGVYTLYAHMSKTFIHEGQIVKQGDVIGTIGATGKATGDHLHFEILFDPMQFCFD